MILKPITTIVIFIISALVWSGVSFSNVNPEAYSGTDKSHLKVVRQADAIAAASTFQAIRKQNEIRTARRSIHPYKRTFLKLVKTLFSPDKRLPKRSFFRNILKL